MPPSKVKTTMVATKEALDKFLDAIELDGIQITNFPCFAFLCGGDRSNADFIRSKVFEYAKKYNPEVYKKIKVAEDFISWTDYEFYRNLSDLESDLAHIVSYVPIILESPGSIAELGSFVSNPIIFEKTQIYIEHEHYKKDSYIYLGPVKKLEDKMKERVMPYSKGATGELVRIIVENIEENTKPLHQKEKLRKTDTSHHFLLICELVNILSVARVSEIKYLLDKINIRHIISSIEKPLSEEIIKKYLKLCEKMGLLRTESLKDIFYIANNTNDRFAVFSFKKHTTKSDRDIIRWKSIIRKHIAQQDRYRKVFLEPRGAA